MARDANDLRTTPLAERFGVAVHDVDLGACDLDAIYPALRALFEEHSALLFRNQTLSDDNHLRLAASFGQLHTSTRIAGR